MQNPRYSWKLPRDYNFIQIFVPRSFRGHFLDLYSNNTTKIFIKIDLIGKIYPKSRILHSFLLDKTLGGDKLTALVYRYGRLAQLVRVLA
jgi:hypothetical protein